jgi:hypothetical protein
MKTSTLATILVFVMMGATAQAGVFSAGDQSNSYIKVTKNKKGLQEFSVCRVEVDKLDFNEICRVPQSRGKSLRDGGYSRQELDKALGVAVTGTNKDRKTLKHLGLTELFSDDAASDDAYVGFPKDKLSDLEDALISGLNDK